MKFPIKLNSSSILAKMLFFFPQVNDPLNFTNEANLKLFSFSASVLKFGKVFKTTNLNRHIITDEFLANYIDENSIILDVGASTGVTSLDLMKKLNFLFKKYFVTDLNLYVSFSNNKNNFYFFDENADCILYRNTFLVVYPQEAQLLKVLFRNKFEHYKNQLKKLLLIDPELKNIADQNFKISIMKYNVFQRWLGPKVNLIKAANIFNKTYFSVEEIIHGLNNLLKVIVDNGILVIIDNREIEKSSIFIKTGGVLKLMKSINGGSEIETLLINKFGA